MSTSRTWVNPNMLRWPRERLGLTPQAVEAHSHRPRRSYYTPVTAEQITRWEQGMEEPDLEHLETLAEIYQCPVGWFFLDKLPEERMALSFRGLKQPPESLSPETRKALERFRNLARWTVDFITRFRFEQTWEVRIRPAEVSPDIRRAEAYKRRLGWTDDVQDELAGDARAAFIKKALFATTTRMGKIGTLNLSPTSLPPIFCSPARPSVAAWRNWV